MYNVTTIVTALLMKFVFRVERRQYWQLIRRARMPDVCNYKDIAACTCV